jgi:hypothetical protein
LVSVSIFSAFSAEKQKLEEFVTNIKDNNKE